jgi:hypothetical protein
MRACSDYYPVYKNTWVGFSEKRTVFCLLVEPIPLGHGENSGGVDCIKLIFVAGSISTGVVSGLLSVAMKFRAGHSLRQLGRYLIDDGMQPRGSMLTGREEYAGSLYVTRLESCPSKRLLTEEELAPPDSSLTGD